MYKVISAESAKILEERVNYWLTQGWDLLGGVSVVINPADEFVFFQAVCLPEIPLED